MDFRTKSHPWHRLRSILCSITALFSIACSNQVTPKRTIQIAESYVNTEWTPTENHVRHGQDTRNILVHTPDTSLIHHGDHRGWWTPKIPAKGMPYKWGGFDTPKSFKQGINIGKKAGDIATSYKIKHDNHVISHESVGIDCSGFISRCWQLPHHHSTRDFPKICDPIPWSELKTGDILLIPGHVILFEAFYYEKIVGYEAGPNPSWKTHRCWIPRSYLQDQGYKAWRYKKMKCR